MRHEPHQSRESILIVTPQFNTYLPAKISPANTELLERTLTVASKLPETEQDSFARWLLSELESERKWDDLFGGSQELLSQLADESIDEHRQRITKRLDADAL